MVQGVDIGVTSAKVKEIVEQKIAPLKKELEEIKALLGRLQTSNKVEHGSIKQDTKSILEDTDKLRYVSEVRPEEEF